MQSFASINPRFPVHPTPSPSPLATTGLFSKSVSFFPVERFICAIYQIPDTSGIIWYASLSFWLTSLGMRVSRSTHVATNGIILFFFYGWVVLAPMKTLERTFCFQGSALTCLHQVLDTDFINWEEGSGCSILWTHVGNGGSVSNG